MHGQAHAYLCLVIGPQQLMLQTSDVYPNVENRRSPLLDIITFPILSGRCVATKNGILFE